MGFAILLTARNQGGKAPWSVVEDVTIERNLILNVSSGISMMARSVPKDDWGKLRWVERLRRVLVRDNVIRLNADVYGGDGFMFLLSSTTKHHKAGEEDLAQDISIVHNTGIHSSTKGKSFVSVGPGVFGDGTFEMKNNILTHGKYGFKGHGKPSGRPGMDFLGTPFVFTSNALVGWTTEQFNKQQYPAGNTHIADLASVKFLAPPLGGDYGSLNFSLANDSPLKGGADDGTDYGARLRTSDLAQRSASEAVHFVPPPPPTYEYTRAVFPPPGYPAPVRDPDTGVIVPVLPKMFEHELTKAEYDPARAADIVITAGTPGKTMRDKISHAPPGSIVELEAGATFTIKGPILLRNHSAAAKGGSPWIVVRSSKHAQLPSGRVGPEHAALMPKLAITTSEPTMRALFGAHHYYILGIEVTVAESNPFNYGLIAIDKDHYLRRPAQSLSELPHHITVDRCYVHGNSEGLMKRGISLDGRYLAVVRSYLDNFQHKTQDTQAIVGTNGDGPFKIVDNYLVASGENGAWADRWMVNRINKLRMLWVGGQMCTAGCE